MHMRDRLLVPAGLMFAVFWECLLRRRETHERASQIPKPSPYLVSRCRSSRPSGLHPAL